MITLSSVLCARELVLSGLFVRFCYLCQAVAAAAAARFHQNCYTSYGVGWVNYPVIPIVVSECGVVFLVQHDRLLLFC